MDLDGGMDWAWDALANLAAGDRSVPSLTSLWELVIIGVRQVCLLWTPVRVERCILKYEVKDVAQWVECLCSMLKALGLILSTVQTGYGSMFL